MADFAKLVLDADTRGLRNAEGDLRNMKRAAADAAQKVGASMAALGKGMTIGLTAPLTLFGKSSVQAAIDAQELQSMFDTTFGSMSASMNMWAEQTGDALGRSTQELQESAAVFQGFFKDMLPEKDAAEFSRQMTVLSQDVASFKNLANDDAQARLFAAVTGEYDSLKALGVVINDTVMKAKAMEMGFGSSTSKLTEQEKVLIRVALLQEKFADASGDVLRTQDSTANQIKKAQAAYEELQVTVGTKLLPVLTPLIEKLGGVLDWLSKLPEPVQETGVAIAALTAALGPMLWAFGSVLTIAPKIATALSAVFAAPWLLAAAAVIAAIYLAWQNWDEIAPLIQPIIDQVKALGEGLGLLQVDVNATQAELAKEDGWRQFGSAIASTGQKIADFIDQSNAAGLAVNRWAKDLISNVSGMVNSVGQWMNNLAARIHAALIGKLGVIWEQVTSKIEAVKRAFYNLYDAVVGHSYIPDMVDGIAQHMARLDTVMVAQAGKATSATAKAFEALQGRVRGIMDRLFPEAAQLNSYRQQLADLERYYGSGKQSASEYAEAVVRLKRELAGVDIAGKFPKPTVIADVIPQPIDGLQEKLGRLGEQTSKQLGLLKEKAGEFGRAASAAFDSFSYQMEGFLLGAQSAGAAIKNLARELASMGIQMAMSSLKTAIGIPGFANGTNFAPGGLAVVGERGAEVVNLPRGSQVIPHNQSRDLMDRAATRNVYMTVKTPDANSFRRSGRQIAREERRRVNY